MEKFLKQDLSVEKVHIACYVEGENNPVQQRKRNSYGLALHVAGEKDYVFFGAQRITVRPWEIVFMPKGSDYDVLICEQGPCYAINFDLAGEPEIAPFRVPVRGKSQCLEHFKSAVRAWEQKKPGYLARCRAELYGIICLMQQEHAMGYMQQEKYSRIRPAVEEIHRAYTERELSVAGLAAVCGMSPEYFRAIFRQKFGVSPLRYIQDLRISRAKELLATGMYTVTEAALRSGYTDMSHFSRVFKAASGVSPVQYLRGER